MNTHRTLAQSFKVLMHPTRLGILDVLRTGEQCVCHMEAVLGQRQAHISQHLMVLRDAGLVIDRRDGWNIYYRVTRPEIYSVIDAMDAFNGDALDKFRPANPQESCPCPKCSPEGEIARRGQLAENIETVSLRSQ